MSRLTLSLLMPNYNHAKYLRTSLGGACTQHRPADEIIVVDDGSTDESVTIIEEFAARNPNLKLVRNERNRGIFDSVDRALALASSDYIAMLAADDQVFPDFVAKSMAVLEKYPQAGLCFSAFAVLDDKTGAVHDRSRDPAFRGAFELWRYPEYMTPRAFRAQLRGGIVWMTGNSVVLRRSAMGGVARLHRELRWHSDWFMNNVVALRHGACVVPEVLCAIRANTESYSSARASDARAQRKVIRAVARKLCHPGRLDLALTFRRYPVLLSPLEQEVLPALARSPFGWPFVMPYARYCLQALIPMRRSGFPELLLVAIGWTLNRRSLRRPDSILQKPPALTVTAIVTAARHAQALSRQTRAPDELLVAADQGGVNRALREAKGHYVYLGSGEAPVSPALLEKMLAAAERHPQTGLVQASLGRMGEYLSPWRYREWLKDEAVDLFASGALIRRDALLEIGGFPEALGRHAAWFALQAIALRYGVCPLAEALASRERSDEPGTQSEALSALFALVTRREFADVWSAFKRHPALLAGLDPSLAAFLPRRPSKWHLLARRALWRFARRLTIRGSDNGTARTAGGVHPA